MQPCQRCDSKLIIDFNFCNKVGQLRKFYLFLMNESVGTFCVPGHLTEKVSFVRSAGHMILVEVRDEL